MVRTSTNNGTFSQATPGLPSELYQKIKPKIGNNMALIISLNGPFEEKYCAAKFKIIPGFRPVEEKGAKISSKIEVWRQYFSSNGPFNEMISAMLFLIFGLIFRYNSLGNPGVA